MKKKLFLFVSISFFLFSCSSTNNLTLTVTQPAPITMPKYIQRIGIVNRTNPIESSNILDKIDKILSVEMAGVDTQGVVQIIYGLQNELQRNSNFTHVKFLDTIYLTSKYISDFSPQIPWNTISRICKQNNVDALFVLEIYDTDTQLQYSNVPVTVKVPIVGDVTTLEHQATAVTTIKVGWKIYDPNAQLIVDTYFYTETVSSTGTGINPMVAASAIIGQKDKVLKHSYGMGSMYAEQLLPYSIRVARDYYVRGTDNFKIAKRRAQTGNWDGAAEMWFKEIENPKMKIAGRAHYNMAISSEINGDLQLAEQWAQKAYTDFNNKLALRYVRILQERQSQQALLEHQLE